MKKYLLSVLPLLMVAGAFSQAAELPHTKAVIVMKDGRQIEDVQLWQIHSRVLEYEQNGNLHDAVIAEIEIVKTPESNYFFNANDSLEKTRTKSPSPTEEISVVAKQDSLSTTPSYLYDLGVKDGNKYYDGTGAAIGGVVSGFVPVLGWVVTMPIIAATRPAMYNTDNPNLSKTPDKNYQEGYHKAATTKKLTNTFGGFAVGLTAFILLFL